MQDFVNAINGIMESALIYLCFISWFIFSIRGRFYKIRHFGHA